jgi:hypothetical protein
MAQTASKPDSAKAAPQVNVTKEQLVDMERQRWWIIAQIQDLQAQIDAIEGVAPLKAQMNRLNQQIQPLLQKEKAAFETYEKQGNCKMNLQTMECNPATSSAPPPK